MALLASPIQKHPQRPSEPWYHILCAAQHSSKAAEWSGLLRRSSAMESESERIEKPPEKLLKSAMGDKAAAVKGGGPADSIHPTAADPPIEGNTYALLVAFVGEGYRVLTRSSGAFLLSSNFCDGQRLSVLPTAGLAVQS
ncbi:unnamed protein product [Ostreobium quekettii]|uniref:Uncharacterized protein n=1 Tax=Ostreobium quekettii TaxID=121088 RepID=A0A8S1JCZ8_9CHLO|nr:unnamed protein product [Ostreobium quekettii]